VPASLRLQESFGDDLQVLFVESQGTPAGKMERFLLNRKWLGAAAIWSTEAPFRTGSRTLPSYVLVGADGRVIEKGDHTSSETTELIEKEIAALRGGPPGTPRALRGAWSAFQKGEVTKAIELAIKIREKGEDAAAADEAIASFTGLIGFRLDRAEWCLENGYLVEADGMLDALRKGVKGSGELADRLASLDDRLSSDEMKQDRDAAAVLQRILKKIHADGFGKKDKHRNSLEKFARKYDGTLAAKRARHLLDL
jgi:hypothetical protein